LSHNHSTKTTNTHHQKVMSEEVVKRIQKPQKTRHEYVSSKLLTRCSRPLSNNQTTHPHTPLGPLQDPQTAPGAENTTQRVIPQNPNSVPKKNHQPPHPPVPHPHPKQRRK